MKSHTRCFGRRAFGSLLAGSAIALSGRRAAAQSGSLDALVAAARAEGGLVFYCGAPEGMPKRAIEGFTKRYNIPAQFVRISSGPLQQRFSTEALSGQIAADFVLLAGNAIPFGREGIEKGWMEPVAKAGIPAIGGEFPSSWLRGDGVGAVVQVAPWVIAYNSEFVKEGDVPKDWSELIAPKFRGQIILADPLASDAYYDEWQTVLDKHGEAWFAGLRAQAIRWRGDGINATNSLAAGECWFHYPVTAAQITDVARKGAPVKMVSFDLTSGVEMTLLMTHPSKAKHPNAAKLFANYLLTAEGSRLFNDDPGIVGPYSGAMPKEYKAPKGVWTPPERDKLRKLLGLS